MWPFYTHLSPSFAVTYFTMQSSILSIAVYGLLASAAVAAPANVQKRSFKVDRVRNRSFQGHNGPKQLLKAYQKYSMPVPPAPPGHPRLFRVVDPEGKGSEAGRADQQ